MTQAQLHEFTAANGRYQRISAWVAVLLALLCLILAWLGAFSCLSCRAQTPTDPVALAPAAPVTSAAASAADPAPMPSSAAVVSAPAPVSAASASANGAGNSANSALNVPSCAGVMDISVSFALGTAKLTPQGRTQLASAAKCINGPTEVGGHSDSVGSQDLNFRLSTARAASAAKYLEQAGVKPEWLSVKGYGPSQPIADNGTPEGRIKNRRITLLAK